MADDEISKPETKEPTWGEFAVEFWDALNKKLKVKNPQKLEPSYKEGEDEERKK